MCGNLIIEYFQNYVNVFLRFFHNKFWEVVNTENILVFDNIKKRAKRAGISINSLEKEAGVSIGSVYKWNAVSPTASSLLRVANVLGCTVDDLLKSDMR